MSNYKPKKKKLTPTSERNKGTVRKKPMTWKRYAMIALLALAIGAWVFSQLPRSNNATEVKEPTFLKEGSLSFVNGNTGSTIKNIDIELANDEAQRAQGLMYRRSMRDDQGMLFIMENNEQQGFWMKNTYISLDIIYVGADSTIVDIYKDAKPLSMKSMPSRGLAKYVVEVNGGWTTTNGVAKGDKIAFELNK
ncbi:MAG: uncharacterized membrane protein (UPF0127 family) [Paraglaciecola sp.]|jgi:uncharacterized membrane protein (UPF0127 family)